MTVLRAEGLTKRFGDRLLWQDISLALAPGEALAVTGPSGCGKTTLLRCLNGLEAADGGRVSVGETRLDHASAPERFRAAARVVRRQVGFVFQGFHLFSHRTVLENVMEGPLYVQREARAVVRSRAVTLLERVGIAHRSDAYPRALSGGEQQRAAIARALAMRPDVLLLDEPTSALDPVRASELATLLRDLMADGLAVLAVTHDRTWASAIATRVLRLDQGRLGQT